LGATQSGQNEYNDQLQFEMTDSYRKTQAAFFTTKYQTELQNVAVAIYLKKKNSYEIIK
jgi:hypothetical protein